MAMKFLYYAKKRQISKYILVRKIAKIAKIRLTNRFLHRKNDFSEIFKNLARYKFENNFVRPLK